jgi:hypothetical protein
MRGRCPARIYTRNRPRFANLPKMPNPDTNLLEKYFSHFAKNFRMLNSWRCSYSGVPNCILFHFPYFPFHCSKQTFFFKKAHWIGSQCLFGTAPCAWAPSPKLKPDTRATNRGSEYVREKGFRLRYKHAEALVPASSFGAAPSASVAQSRSRVNCFNHWRSHRQPPRAGGRAPCQSLKENFLKIQVEFCNFIAKYFCTIKIARAP